MPTDECAWSRYWHFDRVASCLDGPRLANYSEAVAAGWRAFFHSLPKETKVLDICTGNGAIALLAAQVSRTEGKGFGVTGVDQADIDPKTYVTKDVEDLRTIEFVPKVAAEYLPFPDQSFGAIVSQYGIEYSDLSKSLPEVTRTLEPGGSARFVLHAAEGVVRANSESVITDADFLLTRLDIFAKARRCIEAVVGVERKPAPADTECRAADECFASFGKALESSADYMGRAGDPEMIRNAASVLLDSFQKRGYFDLPELLAKIDEVRREVVCHRGRSLALIEASQSREQIGEIAEMFRSAGAWQASCSELNNDEGLIAHVLEARFGEPPRGQAGSSSAATVSSIQPPPSTRSPS